MQQGAQQGTRKRDREDAHPEESYRREFASFHARLYARNELLKNYSVWPSAILGR